jgi:hypothetical protein
VEVFEPASMRGAADLGSKLGRRGGKPAVDGLKHGTAHRRRARRYEYNRIDYEPILVLSILHRKWDVASARTALNGQNEVTI